VKRFISKFLVLSIFIFFSSCENESTCETERNCYSDGSGGQTCIETPIPGTCIDNSFGF